MRVRVLVPLVLCTLAAVLAVILPALEATSRDRTQQLVLSRSGSLDRLTALAGPAVETGELTALEQHAQRYVQLYAEPVVVLDAAGTPVLVEGDIDPADPQLRELAAQATRNLPHDEIDTIRPWSTRYHLLARPINPSGDATGAVLLKVDASRALSDVRRQWLLLLAGALAVEVLLVGLTLALTRWVLRPVRRLDDAAISFAHGDPPSELSVGGPPELRRLAGSFDSMARTVTATLEQQRRLVADSSHQLRNPLAAIRLRIDAMGPAVDPHVTNDLDRLEHTVDKLLVLAEADHRASSWSAGRAAGRRHRPDLPATDLFLGEVLDRWADRTAAAGVVLRTDGDAHVRVRCTASDLHEMLDSILDNAVKYAGRGSVVSVRTATVSRSVRLSVSDDGPGLPAAEIPLAGQRFWRSARVGSAPGTGLGLAIVGQLARANGGTADVRETPGGGLTVELTLAADDE